MENKNSKIDMAATGFSVLILLLIFILAFQPVITANGGRRRLDIGTMAGKILGNAARVVDDDEEEELEEAVEELSDYEGLSVISGIQIMKQYAKYSSNIYESYVTLFIAFIIFTALVLIMELLLVVVVFCLLLRTVIDFIKKECEIADVCKRMSLIFGIWTLSVMAGVSFCEFCDIENATIKPEFGFAFSMIGILSIVMCFICMFLKAVLDKAWNKRLHSRLIAAALFFTAIIGAYGLKADAFKIEYSMEADGNDYVDRDFKVSFASLPTWETMQTMSVVEEINTKISQEEAKDYVGKMVKSTAFLLAGLVCVVLLVVMYSISMGNFAFGMCGYKYSMAKQIICSLLGIIFVILLAVLLRIGMGQIGDIMEKIYSDRYDSLSCKFYIKYKIGYFIPFLVNIAFLVLSIVKNVFDRKLQASMTNDTNSFYPQNMVYPQNQNYSQNQVYSQGVPGQETAYTSERQMSNICPNCGAENEAGNRFCSRCGQQI